MNRVLLVSIIIVSLAIGFLGGYLLGSDKGEKVATQKLEPVINQVFPKPANDIRNASGVVKNITGNNIEIEIPDPNDYIPHADGSPIKRISLIGTADGTTKISIVVLSNGFSQSPATISDLKVGDSVGFGASENIRDKERVQLAYLEIVR